MRTLQVAASIGFIMMLGVGVSALAGTDMPKPKVDGASNHIKTLVLGSGCFWGPEKRYEKMTGVIDAESGYADGKGFKPSYREIIKSSRRFDEDNYAEVVKVTYNANLITTDALLKYYFESHDPTQKNRQGNDVGTQYRSIILYTDEQQSDKAHTLKAQYQHLLSEQGYGDIQTKIKPLRKFYPAEEYHQNYLTKNPKGYCPDHSTGVTFEKVAKDKADNTMLAQGKHIVIVDAKSYCPYCEKLKKEVLNDYQGDIPLHFRYADQTRGANDKNRDLGDANDSYLLKMVLSPLAFKVLWREKSFIRHSVLLSWVVQKLLTLPFKKAQKDHFASSMISLKTHQMAYLSIN